MAIAAQLNVTNIDAMLQHPPRRFLWIRFDSTNNCNLHCVYCHNARSDELIDLVKLRTFLDRCVDRVINFQFGCVMEPTLDKRMADIMLLVARSRGMPRRQMVLQTNGVLLNTHDHDKMNEAGLTHLSLSIDSNNADTFKLLRGGANINKIFRNMSRFREKCPEVEIQFITTVNTANIGEMSQLIEQGLELEVKRFIIREMFFDTQSSIVNHDEMRKLLLPPGEFLKMQNRIQKNYGGRAHFHFSGSDQLIDYAADVRAASIPVTVPLDGPKPPRS